MRPAQIAREILRVGRRGGDALEASMRPAQIAREIFQPARNSAKRMLLQ